MTVHSPSGLCDIVNVLAPIAVLDTTTTDCTAMVDMEGFEFALVILSMGVGDCGVTIDIEDAPTDGGAVTAVTDRDAVALSMSLTATNDGDTIGLEVPWHGQQRWLNLEVTTVAEGVSSLYSIVVLRFKNQYSTNLVALTTETAELGLS